MAMKSVLDISLNINLSDGDVSVAELVQAQMVFFFFVVFDAPSVLCSLMVLYYFARLRELRRQYPANQIIIYLLIGSFMLTVVDVLLIRHVFDQLMAGDFGLFRALPLDFFFRQSSR